MAWEELFLSYPAFALLGKLHVSKAHPLVVALFGLGQNLIQVHLVLFLIILGPLRWIITPLGGPHPFATCTPVLL